MFMIHMPPGFKLGDTADVRINAEPRRLTWRDRQHLVIEPGDVRAIVSIRNEGDLICFICGDADGDRSFTIFAPDMGSDTPTEGTA